MQDRDWRVDTVKELLHFRCRNALTIREEIIGITIMGDIKCRIN